MSPRRSRYVPGDAVRLRARRVPRVAATVPCAGSARRERWCVVYFSTNAAAAAARSPCGFAARRRDRRDRCIAPCGAVASRYNATPFDLRRDENMTDATAPILRAANDDDVPFLVDLRRRNQSTLALPGAALDDTEIARLVRTRFDCAQVIEIDGQPAGVVKVTRNEDSWRLLEIQLLPQFHGLGLGRRILQDLIADADRAQVAAVHLSVLRNNPAEALYRRLGFRVVSETATAFEMTRPGPAPAGDAPAT
jgi:ribosomal protein S18 acetylase RimI-like enzyme